MLLGKAEILAVADLKHEDVAVPEWGGTVRVRMMTGAERDAWEASFLAATMEKGATFAMAASNVRARLASMTLVGEDGALLFTLADIEALGKKSAAALDRVFAVAQRLNGLSEKDLDDLGKLFASIAAAGSSSSSPNG